MAKKKPTAKTPVKKAVARTRNAYTISITTDETIGSAKLAQGIRNLLNGYNMLKAEEKKGPHLSPMFAKITSVKMSPIGEK